MEWVGAVYHILNEDHRQRNGACQIFIVIPHAIISQVDFAIITMSSLNYEKST